MDAIYVGEKIIRGNELCVRLQGAKTNFDLGQMCICFRSFEQRK